MVVLLDYGVGVEVICYMVLFMLLVISKVLFVFCVSFIGVLYSFDLLEEWKLVIIGCGLFIGFFCGNVMNII